MPFADDVGIELTQAAGGNAAGRLTLEERHSSSRERVVAHGGVAYALADTVGAAAVLSINDFVTPTVDMRMDYLAPVTADGTEMRATAEVLSDGDSVATVEVTVTDDDGETVATARGTYKTGGGGGETAWGGDG